MFPVFSPTEIICVAIFGKTFCRNIAVVTVDQLPEWRSRGSKYADLIESVDKAVPGLKFPQAATFTIPNGNANGIYSAISDHVMSKYNKPTRRFWVRKTETGAAVVPVQPESK